MGNKKQIIGFDGTIMYGDIRQDRVAKIKHYLKQWMNSGDIIAWHTDHHGDDEGKPNCAVVITAFGAATDARATIQI